MSKGYTEEHAKLLLEEIEAPYRGVPFLFIGVKEFGGVKQSLNEHTATGEPYETIKDLHTAFRNEERETRMFLYVKFGYQKNSPVMLLDSSWVDKACR